MSFLHLVLDFWIAFSYLFFCDCSWLNVMLLNDVFVKCSIESLMKNTKNRWETFLVSSQPNMKLSWDSCNIPFFIKLSLLEILFWTMRWVQFKQHQISFTLQSPIPPLILNTLRIFLLSSSSDMDSMGLNSLLRLKFNFHSSPSSYTIFLTKSFLSDIFIGFEKIDEELKYSLIFAYV